MTPEQARAMAREIGELLDLVERGLAGDEEAAAQAQVLAAAAVALLGEHARQLARDMLRRTT
jgi:hypothetical protein